MIFLFLPSLLSSFHSLQFIQLQPYISYLQKQFSKHTHTWTQKTASTTTNKKKQNNSTLHYLLANNNIKPIPLPSAHIINKQLHIWFILIEIFIKILLFLIWKSCYEFYFHFEHNPLCFICLSSILILCISDCSMKA